ncbi:MAG TPA: HAD family phosphatase [Actinomycetota bacterium]|nr:HAD family phosphatase [Actinomycetota bacterium]
MSEIKGLIVDFGGVLTTSVFDSFRAFCIENELDIEILKAVLRGAFESSEPEAENWVHKMETGQITADEFNKLLAEGLSAGREKPIDAEGLKDRLFANCKAEPEMFDLLREARGAGVKTALLSNSWGGDGYPRDSFEELFDAVVISGEEGFRKPQPEIYRLAAERLDLTPEECVFVDDFEVNTKGAEAVGMQTIHHTSVDKTVGQVKKLISRS